MDYMKGWRRRQTTETIIYAAIMAAIGVLAIGFALTQESRRERDAEESEIEELKTELNGLKRRTVGIVPPAMLCECRAWFLRGDRIDEKHHHRDCNFCVAEAPAQAPLAPA